MNDNDLVSARPKFRLADNVRLVAGALEWAIYRLDDHDIIRITPDEGRRIQNGDLNGSSIRQLIDAGIFYANGEPTSSTTQASADGEYDSIPFRSAWLELTDVCNLSCSHCYMNANHIRPKSKTNWWKVLKYLATHHCQQAIFIGGEPLCNSEFIKYVKFSKRIAPQMRVCVVTNGTLWNESLLNQMKKLDVFMKFSLLGSSPERHDRITGVSGSFDKTVENIDLAIRLGIRFEIATTLIPSSSETAESIEHFIAARFGKVKHSTARVRPQGRQLTCKNSSGTCSEEQLAVHISRKFFNLANRLHPCLYGKAAFSCSGIVHPCIMSRFEKLDVATVLKQKPGNVFRRWWTLTKDKINGCCSCALRYACFDCRGFATSMTEPPSNCRLSAKLTVPNGL